MIATESIEETKAQIHEAPEQKVRRVSKSKDPVIFTDIFEEESNIAIWQRELPEALKKSVSDFLEQEPSLEIAMTLSPDNALSSINEALGKASNISGLSENIAELVDMYAYLFALKRVGLRLTVLERAMCPKFHVDKVPCRLVTTYQGTATEWLPHECIDRTKLGSGSNGLPDWQTGLYQNNDNIQQLNAGDVALLKGENWEGNENAGLVHRSPSLPGAENRLLLTLDFSD